MPVIFLYVLFYCMPAYCVDLGITGFVKKKVRDLDKKVRAYRAEETASADMTAPLISGIGTVNLGISSTTISWVTSESATSQVEYGTSTAYGTQTQTDTSLVISHEVLITNLEPGTTYYFRVISSDPYGNSSSSSANVFMSAPVVFTRLPFDIENVGGVMTIGNFVFTHTRSNPQTVRPYGMERHAMYHKSPGTAYNAYSPATTYIVSVRKSQGIGDYGFNFKLGGDVYFRHDHIHAIDPELEAKITAQLGGPLQETSAFEPLSEPIYITAGTLLGTTGFKAGSVNWDWFVGEGSPPNDGVTNPEHYVTSMAGLFMSAKSCYDYASDDVKTQLESLAGYWDGSSLAKRKGVPALGKCGHDIDGTLSGIWFYDYSDDATWGPKLAAFTPYFLDTSSATVKLAIPELDLYGVWNTTYTNVAANINLPPESVTESTGIAYYILNVHDNDENGLLMVRVNPNDTITIETHKDVFDPSGYTVFSSSAIILQR